MFDILNCVVSNFDNLGKLIISSGAQLYQVENKLALFNFCPETRNWTRKFFLNALEYLKRLKFKAMNIPV